MLPTPDFNFVVCGIATIAATVGYACARKVRPLPSRGTSQHLPVPAECPEDNSSRDEVLKTPEKSVDEPNPNGENADPDLEAEPILAGGDNSLKRKRSHDQDEDELDVLQGYPHNLTSIYPNKRRSGSVSDADPNETTEEISPAPCCLTNEHPQIAVADSGLVVDSEFSGVAPSVDAALSDSVSSLPSKPDVEDIPIPEVPKVEPAPADPPRFVFPQSPPRITQFPYTRSRPSSGFANFAGSSSPFHSPTPTRDGASVFGKSIWAGATETAAVETAAPISDADHEGKTDPLLPALLAAKTPAPSTQTHLTGEEEEDVILELKGVKLFVKRGDDNFSGGMVGHLKVLSHKMTHSKRLLFRREPLWKVSMNVRMQSTVRFSFDTQENILRVALKELEEKSDSSQTVIYAFKPGRSCRRCDFQEFAESLLAQARAGEQ